jgi:hypothetical protein
MSPIHRPVREASIVEALRTPVGQYGSAAAFGRSDNLATLAIHVAVGSGRRCPTA